MCITDYQFDEALELIKPHAPHAVDVIEKYVEQLKLENAELQGLIAAACDLLIKKG